MSAWFFLTSLLAGRWGLPGVRADSPSWDSAWIHPGSNGAPVLTLFPLAGRKTTLDLPGGLPPNLTLNRFSRDGRAIYVQRASEPSAGVIKIGFKPLRETTLPGSVGLGTVWHLTELPGAADFAVAGISTNPRECGTFEVDTNTRVLRTLMSGPYPSCGGGGGEVSPDGKRAARFANQKLVLNELGTGSVHVIDGIESRASESDASWIRNVAWSPDGRWISVVTDEGKIILVDSDDTNHRRNLGPSRGPFIVWSPDSKHLLLLKSEFRCALYLYFESLEILDVETGKRTTIKSSRCEVGPGWVGWIDAASIR